jgi:phosphate-selective porin OprO/OprP
LLSATMRTRTVAPPAMTNAQKAHPLGTFHPGLLLLLVTGIILLAGSRAVGDTSEPHTPQRQVRWYLDHGLNVEVRRLGLLEQVAGPASELLLHVQAGFRLSADGAAFAGDDQGSEPGGLRRAYIRVAGEFWPWRRPVKFYLEIGVVNREFSLDTSYLTFPALPYIGDLQAGQLDPPMSLDALSSSFARPFMEKSLPVDALVPNSKTGLLSANRTASQDVTWALGWFADGASREEGENNKSPTRVSGRLTWLASAGGEEEVPLVHLGAYASYMYSANKQIRYDTRAESNWAPKLFDTANIDGRGAIVLGNEMAAAHGPWSVQGELLVARVQGANASDSDFSGAYVLGTWSLTGEPRPYNRTKGIFAALVPQRPVAFGTRNIGAWEAVLRLSYLNLVDGPVRGGRGIELMPGLNWYLTQNIRLQLEYGYTHVEDGPQNGNLHLVQARFDLSL